MKQKPNRPKRVSEAKGRGINLYFYPEDERRLDELCKALEMSRSAVVARLLRGEK